MIEFVLAVTLGWVGADGAAVQRQVAEGPFASHQACLKALHSNMVVIENHYKVQPILLGGAACEARKAKTKAQYDADVAEAERVLKSRDAEIDKMVAAKRAANAASAAAAASASAGR
jgi:hypothetical protein